MHSYTLTPAAVLPGHTGSDRWVIRAAPCLGLYNLKVEAELDEEADSCAAVFVYENTLI